MKKLLLLIGFFICVEFAYAGPFDADRVVPDYGDQWFTSSILTSTDTVVLISSATESLASMKHRSIEITNVGGDELVLYPSSSYVVFESTRGIHLSSFTSTATGGQAPYPRTYKYSGTAPFWGIWNTGGTETNVGALINIFNEK